MEGLLTKTLLVYAIAIVVSFMVAGLIRLLVAATARMKSVTALSPGAQEALVCPVDVGIPDTDVAAIAAAVAAMIGAHRIVHIAEGGHGHTWTAEGRLAHHTSHALPHRPRL
jgi:hypothetical protein